MTSYELSYFGRDLDSFRATIAYWCAGHDCVLETTALLRGVRLRITGPEETVREAIRTVRVWMRHTA